MVATSSPVSALSPSRLAGLRRALPGVVAALVGGALAVGLGEITPVPALMAAIVIGALAANVPGLLPPSTTPGLQLVAKRLLRVGIVLLGFRLSLADVQALGPSHIALVVVIVAATFVGTRALGRRLGVPGGLSLLTATGFAICGASAVAAAAAATDADDEDVAVAVVLVTLYGTLALVTLPLIAGAIGLGPEEFGAWVGASVHDVGQVVAASSTGGPTALHAAVVVKLCRVVLLAPVVAGLGLARRRHDRLEEGPTTGRARRTPPVPVFVLGFLGAIAARSTGLVPAPAVDLLQTVELWVLCIALCGLGAGVRIASLRRVSLRPVVLGLAAWIFIAGASLVGGRLLA